MVPMTGLEPARRVANAPKAFVSTFPPHRHMAALKSANYESDYDSKPNPDAYYL